MLTCNGELGKPGAICTHINITHDTKCPDAVDCPGCSVCHGNCETCGGTGEVDVQADDWPAVCYNYQPAKGDSA